MMPILPLRPRLACDSCGRVLDAVPARPHTGRAPNPRNPAESAPRSYPAATPHPRRRRLIENHHRGNGGETGMVIRCGPCHRLIAAEFLDQADGIPETPVAGGAKTS